MQSKSNAKKLSCQADRKTSKVQKVSYTIRRNACLEPLRPIEEVKPLFPIPNHSSPSGRF